MSLGREWRTSFPHTLPAARLLPLWQVLLWQVVLVHLLWQQFAVEQSL
ncbi:MAG: hypothetical protein ACK5EA_16420 [Planctomycetaceae bacterium]